MAASGVGTVDCTRHDMKHPASVGDLQKGERYVFTIVENIFISTPSFLDMLTWGIYEYDRIANDRIGMRNTNDRIGAK